MRASAIRPRRLARRRARGLDPAYGVATLGSFGGSITLKFDHTVKDDADNPNGIDAIVFGNGFRTGTPPRSKFMEPGVIEISKDANGNGLADDPWYVDPGSHIADARHGLDNQAVHLSSPYPTLFYPDKNSAYGLAWITDRPGTCNAWLLSGPRVSGRQPHQPEHQWAGRGLGLCRLLAHVDAWRPRRRRRRGRRLHFGGGILQHGR